MNIKLIQNQLHDWQVKNFGASCKEDQFLGITEELGELVEALIPLLAVANGKIAHAILKTKQGIRGYDEDKCIDEVKDAIGDMFIYTLNLATHLNIDLEKTLEDTIEHVLGRDWVENKLTGSVTDKKGDD